MTSGPKDSKPWPWIFPSEYIIRSDCVPDRLSGKLCNCAFSFIIIFRADLFLIDWGLLGPSLALSCSGQSTWQPSKDHACRRCCRLPLLTGGYRLGLRLPLFFHSGLLFLGLGWLSKSYWMLCRVGALSCTVYVGNCVHCSGLISWCLHFSFFVW